MLYSSPVGGGYFIHPRISAVVLLAVSVVVKLLSVLEIFSVVSVFSVVVCPPVQQGANSHRCDVVDRNRYVLFSFLDGGWSPGPGCLEELARRIAGSAP